MQALGNREHARDIAISSSTADLRERNFIDATCAYVTNCALKVVETTGYYVGITAGAFVAGITNEEGETDIWGFLNSPFVLALTINQGASALGGVVSAVTSNKVAASQCSTQNTDADTILSIATRLSEMNPDRAIMVTLSLPDGRTGTLSIEAVPNGQRGDGNTCGAPATDPSTSRKRDTLEWDF